MKKIFLIIAIIFCPELFGQGGFFVKAGMDYNFVTAGAFKHLGYDNNKYLFTGFSGGFGLYLEGGFVYFDYTDFIAKAKLKGKESDLKFSAVTLSGTLNFNSSNPVLLGITAELGIIFASEIAGGTMRIGPEVNLFLIKNIGFYAAGLLNLGYIRISDSSNALVESSDGLATGPELKAGIKLLF